jgi:hypothetical protein
MFRRRPSLATVTFSGAPGATLPRGSLLESSDGKLYIVKSVQGSTATIRDIRWYDRARWWIVGRWRHWTGNARAVRDQVIRYWR